MFQGTGLAFNLNISLHPLLHCEELGDASNIR